MLFYANDPFDADNPRCQDGNNPNGISDGEINGGLSHEHIESVTDPIPNDAWTNGVGADQGEEVGDQCNRQRGTPLGTAPNGAKYNQVINGHFYWYQEEWSNLGHGCVQRLTLPHRLPTARERVTAGSGTRHDVRRQSVDRTRRRGRLQLAVQRRVRRPDRRADNADDHAHVPGGRRVLHRGGRVQRGRTVGRDRRDRDHGPERLHAGVHGLAAQRRPEVGMADDRTVRFSALTTVSGQPVINYLWEFGDGSTGSGATPTHTYTRPGTYTVTAVLFSGVGSAFPGAGAGPIYQHTVTVGRPQ